MRRAIQRHLENPLARSVLAGELSPGDHVLVDAGPDGVTLTRQDSSAPGESERTAPALM